MHDIATALGVVTVDSLIEQAMQGGLWGVALAMIVWGVRSVWLFLKPHIGDLLKARLKRYETTTRLTEELQKTQYDLVEQQKQIVELLRANSRDSRAHRKAVQAIEQLMRDHKCLYGVDVKGRLSDSDDFDLTEQSDDSDQTPKP
jgi:ABC-type multidrug transport system fused ATPase/permease subunit